MTRHSLFVLPALLLFSEQAIADDALVLSGHYYLERSTRIYEPIVRLQKDLPGETELDVDFVVDQITSASGAFTPEDVVFSEYRWEASTAVSKKLNDTFKPGVNLRASYEPDYTSTAAGANVDIALDRETTTLTFFAQFQYDWVRRRINRGTINGETVHGYSQEGNLGTTLLGAAITQVVRKDLIAGGSLEARVLRGFQENVYRPETHPRERNRYTASVFGAYFFEPSDTSLRATYRIYGDNWKLLGHTLDFEANQDLGPIGLFARFRYYTQNEVCFASNPDERKDETGICGPEFNTMDPKLLEFHSLTYGLGLRLPLPFLARTGVPSMANSRVEPSYTYIDQKNFYGAAHVVQLLWYWPF